jgi:hypothetical protein
VKELRKELKAKIEHESEEIGEIKEALRGCTGLMRKSVASDSLIIFDTVKMRELV